MFIFTFKFLVAYVCLCYIFQKLLNFQKIYSVELNQCVDCFCHDQGERSQRNQAKVSSDCDYVLRLEAYYKRNEQAHQFCSEMLSEFYSEILLSLQQIRFRRKTYNWQIRIKNVNCEYVCFMDIKKLKMKISIIKTKIVRKSILEQKSTPFCMYA